jgi:hypothetical protein
MHLGEWVLNLAQYLGLLLAGGSTLWTATHVESKEVRGKKKLTRAGKISVFLVIFGLLLNITSKILQDQADSTRRDQVQKLEEIRFDKTRLAAQQLGTLQLNITFSGVNPKVIAQFDSAQARLDIDERNEQGGVIDGGGDPYQILRHRLLYVFLRDLGRLGNQFPLEGYNPKAAEEFNDSNPDRNILALVALDQSQNVVLPIGLLDSTISFHGNEQKNFPNNAFAGGIAYNQFERFHFGSDKLQGRVRSLENYPELRSTGNDTVTIAWDLDPASLSMALDIGNPLAATTAALPPEIRMVVLFNIKNLPFDGPNFAKPAMAGFWSTDTTGNNWRRWKNPLFSHARAVFVPNNNSPLASTYHLTEIRDENLQDEENLGPYECQAVVFVFYLDDNG